MSTLLALSGPPRPPAVRPAGPGAAATRVIDLDVREPVADPRLDALARRAAARYVAHGTALLGEASRSDDAVRTQPGPAGAGWTVVGRWLGFVAVLGGCFVAYAWSGHLVTR